MSTDATREGEPAAEWVPRTSLKRWPRNPRENEPTVPETAASIRRFGWTAAMVARRADREIIAGHTRDAAAELLVDWWEKATTRERATWHPDAVRVATRGEVVVRFVDLDEHDAHLAAIGDNKIPELSKWKEPLLGEVLRDLRAAERDLVDGTGMSGDMLSKLLGDGPTDSATGGDPGGDRYHQQFGVIVICPNEAEQQRVYERLKADGLACRVVVT